MGRPSRKALAASVGAAAILTGLLGTGVAMAAGTPAPTAPTTPAAPGAPSAPAAPGAPEKTTPEADGPGGHADTAGSNVDHQFDGQE